MYKFKLWITAVLLCAVSILDAHVPDWMRPALKQERKAEYRAQCANSRAQIDQAINNVRARLLAGGDCWWDFTNGRYIVPKVDPSTGQIEVSSIFAGSVWLGGVDPAGNLKLACQDYRPQGRNDFWPGPLREDGTTDAPICSNWDRHFRVTGEEIRLHLRNLAEGNTSVSSIPRNLRGWPARENPYFADVWGFDLPNTVQGLAGFHDANKDFKYNPLDGDYPSIEIENCEDDTRYPDEMIFWIYNDEGGGAPHARTNGTAIRMEVQVQAFGYVTSDELNDMTFQRYKLINRANERIDSTFFAMWVDADLGCALDDYVGCDTSRSLMYIYNQDATDGQPGCACDNGVATYCNEVPMLGVDYFQGPKRQIDTIVNGKDTLIERQIGMSSFTYYNNGSIGDWPDAMTDPDQPIEFYRYLTGSWRDGTSFTYGGSGYRTGQDIKYAFTDEPNIETGWSMCTANLAFGDRRTIQASGPFRLNPGTLNQLIIGVPWVPNIQDLPCPDLESLLRADKLAQGLFDACFERLEGPDAPDVSWIELNKEIVAVLTNNQLSNNFAENYQQYDFLAPDSIRNGPDSLLAKYRFEGYLIYQLSDPNVSASDYDDAQKARLVYQVDVRNGVSNIYNWEETRDPNNQTNRVYFPRLMVSGADAGIKHTFTIREDNFALGNNRALINHKKYYFSVVAYAHNEFGKFVPSPTTPSGQIMPYLAGSRNIQIYTVIPRPIIDQVLNAQAGASLPITRLEGVGTGNHFLDLDDDTRKRVLEAGFDSTLGYRGGGNSPIDVTVFNPFEIKDGDYEIKLVDNDLNDKTLAADARWELRRAGDANAILSDKSIESLNEQIVANYGFAVSIAQVEDAGQAARRGTGGGLGQEIEYTDANIAWLTGYPDDISETNRFDFVEADESFNELEYFLDPKRSLVANGNGIFVPYIMANWRTPNSSTPNANRMITPAWTHQINLNRFVSFEGDNNRRHAVLDSLPNVDIVLTPDKSKWSRCVVIEGALSYYTNTPFPKAAGLEPESPPGGASKRRLHFDTRFAPSVSKDDNDGNGLPDPDNSGTTGMGWFPGYAIDVETGRRLNIFFAENSVYQSSIDPKYTGRDMLWNPTDQVFRDVREDGDPVDYYDFVLGGQHWIYVTNSTYDECENLRKVLTPEITPNINPGRRAGLIREKLAWTGMVQLATGAKLNSLKDGLIPTETRIKIRVQNSYQTWFDNDGPQPSGHPTYRFSIKGLQPSQLQAGVQVENALDSIKMVPNPYYGYSAYETSQFTNTVKITNLPAKCTVTIYSLDGKFIRQYQRDEVYQPYRQITPALEWDLKNTKGIPVASGVYLVHVNAPGMGERTLKWFGIARQFDPSGL